MPYEVTIRCAVRKGNPIEKQRCHSDAQARVAVPAYEATTSREAVSRAELDAKSKGWKRIRRAGRSATWACPVCSD